jgi:hypothetical protein
MDIARGHHLAVQPIHVALLLKDRHAFMIRGGN